MPLAWLNRFRKKALSSELISKENLVREPVPSLFIFGNIYYPYGYLESRHAYSRISGTIADIGFANSWRDSLSETQERTRDFSAAGFCSDRFLSVQLGDCGNGLARIEVDEQLVEDQQMRAALDYTGFAVKIIIREPAFRLIQDHLESLPADVQFPFSKPCVLQIPVLPFAFPPTRGNADPWTIRPIVGELKPIQRFHIDHIAVTMMCRDFSINVPAEGPIYDRYQPLLRSTLSIDFR